MAKKNTIKKKHVGKTKRTLHKQRDAKTVRPPEPVATASSVPDEDGSLCDLVDATVTAISRDALAQVVERPVDTARAFFTLDTVTATSSEEFYTVVSSFCLHIGRHTQALADPVSADAAGREAYALLERAFARRGGVAAAETEAREPMRGGLRYVLDVLTNQIKTEAREKHIQMVLHDAIDTMGWDDQVDFMSTLMARLRPYLPADLSSSPPEQFVHELPILIRTYAESLEGVAQAMRAL